MKHLFYSSCIIAALCLPHLAGCTSASSARAGLASKTPEPVASAPSAPTEPSYDETKDEMARLVDAEENPFYRRTLARLWQATATAQQGNASDRHSHARAAVERADEDVKAIDSGLCVQGLETAIDRAMQAKASFERRYLLVSEQEGHQSAEAKLLDVQVHVLRDDIDELERRALPCRKAILSPGKTK